MTGRQDADVFDLRPRGASACLRGVRTGIAGTIDSPA